MPMTSQDPIVRYEVVGLEADRDLMRSLAERLAKGGPHADQMRADIARFLAGKGGIVAALLRSPLTGSDLDLTRDHAPSRGLDL